MVCLCLRLSKQFLLVLTCYNLLFVFLIGSPQSPPFPLTKTDSYFATKLAEKIVVTTGRVVLNW